MVALRAIDPFRSGGGRRRLLLTAVVGLVALVHAWVGHQFSETVASWHQGEEPIKPLEVTVRSVLKPATPVRRPPAPPPVEAVAEATADAAPPAMPAVAPEPQPTSSVTEPAPAPQTTPPVPEPAAPPAAPPVDPWPPSTRIRYTIVGNYRGEFGGTAQVLWLREADRYRVEMQVSIGPRVAPVFSRRVSSEGRLTTQGLVPRRYDEETRVIFSRTRRVSMNFEAGAPGEGGSLVLPDGRRRPAPPGTQDSASQFVQLAWLFGTYPTPLKAGDRVSFPLALMRRSDTWTYTVGEPEKVDTPAGAVETIHARPQRELDPLRRDMLAEVWFAPALQYLPVRMRVVLDADTYALLIMEGLPEVVQQGVAPVPDDRLPPPTPPSSPNSTTPP